MPVILTTNCPAKFTKEIIISTNQSPVDTTDILATIRQCIPALEKMADQSELMALLPESERIALTIAAGKISRPDREEIKKRNKDRK